MGQNIWAQVQNRLGATAAGSFQAQHPAGGKLHWDQVFAICICTAATSPPPSWRHGYSWGAGAWDKQQQCKHRFQLPGPSGSSGNPTLAATESTSPMSGHSWGEEGREDHDPTADAGKVLQLCRRNPATLWTECCWPPVLCFSKGTVQKNCRPEGS